MADIPKPLEWTIDPTPVPGRFLFHYRDWAGVWTEKEMIATPDNLPSVSDYYYWRWFGPIPDGYGPIPRDPALDDPIPTNPPMKVNS